MFDALVTYTDRNPQRVWNVLVTFIIFAVIFVGLAVICLPLIIENRVAWTAAGLFSVIAIVLLFGSYILHTAYESVKNQRLAENMRLTPRRDK